MNAKAKLRLPQTLAVITAFSGCSSQPEDYNCLLRGETDGGVTLTFRDGGPAEPGSCSVPHCNGSLDAGYGRLVYRAPNGDQSPCMA